MKLNLGAREARLREVVLRLVGIVVALRDVCVEELVECGNRVVVRERRMAIEHLVAKLGPVDGILQGEAKVVVRERRLVGMHRHGNGRAARNAQHLYARRLCENL